MLNDILHQMEPMERYKYAQLLAHLASVDNTISKEELAFFEQRLGATFFRLNENSNCVISWARV